jgi:hypothetical protein
MHLSPSALDQAIALLNRRDSSDSNGNLTATEAPAVSPR